MSGSGIRWAVCKSAPRSRQITTPAPHRSVFYRPHALPAAQPTVSTGMINVDLYSAIITKVSNALNTLVSGEKPGFQALSGKEFQTMGRAYMIQHEMLL